jgi:DNA-binding NarL/FixJ family response regulator
MSTIRVVLADDHPLFLSGLENLLNTEGGFQIVSLCRDGHDALKAVQEHLPDILVLDIRMPGKDGFAVLREIRERDLPVKVVLLSGELSEQDVIRTVRLGVNGIVLKEMAPRLLVQCLRKVSTGAQWLERNSFTRAMEKLLRHGDGLEEMSRVLTGREVEVVKMVGRGLRNREIAEKLFICEGTVKIHLHNVFRKLSVQSRAQLMLYAQSKALDLIGSVEGG